jgi:hypothetical protein
LARRVLRSTVVPASSGWQSEQTFFSLSCDARVLPLEHLTDTHRQVLRYWNEMRGTDHVPPRAGLDPCDLPRALANVALWDADDDYRCRLAGTAVDGGMGCHLRGLTLSDMRCSLLDEARSEFAMVRDSGLVSFAERTLGWVGKPHRYYRHLILPLRNTANEIGQLLSVLTFHNVSERAPRLLVR